MTQYLPKAALVAEIERRIKVLQNNPYENHKIICHLDSLKQSINTLEVKEVDLNEEIKSYFKGFGKFASVGIDDCIDIAKHFFEFGLAQKGE